MRRTLVLLVCGVALGSASATARAQSARQTAVLAGGCFWGMQYLFEHVAGVSRVTAGYAGGTAASADYEKVSGGDTGQAESVEITFDPAVVSYATLLDVFFSVAHDPTQLNRQGPDVGTQYRSAVFYANETQRRVAEETIARLQRSSGFPRPIVTQVAPLRGFYRAESYHQDYAAHHLSEPYIVVNDLPKLTNLRARYPNLYREPGR